MKGSSGRTRLQFFFFNSFLLAYICFASSFTALIVSGMLCRCWPFSFSLPARGRSERLKAGRWVSVSFKGKESGRSRSHQFPLDP